MFRFNHPKEAAKLREKRKVRAWGLVQVGQGYPPGSTTLPSEAKASSKEALEQLSSRHFTF